MTRREDEEEVRGEGPGTQQGRRVPLAEIFLDQVRDGEKTSPKTL